MKPALSVLLLLTPLSCNPPSDLGHPCELRVDGGLWTDATSPTDDFIFQGTTECENLVCLRPAGTPLDAGYGICSNICTPAPGSGGPNALSDDCNGQASGLVCRQISLSQDFIDLILAQDGGQALLESVLGTSCASSKDPGCRPTYCTTPLSPQN